MKLKNTFLILAFFFLFFSCKKKDDKTPPPQNIKVVAVIQKDVPIYEDFVGQVYGKRDIPIRARVEGFLEKKYFQEGAKVKKGTLLYKIDPKPFLEKVVEQQSLVAEAETMLVQAESDLKRVKPLAEMDAVSQRELDMAQAKRDASEASLKAAKAKLNIAQINLGYTNIYAPITGVIGRSEADEGEFVGKNPNPVILNTISDISKIRVRFFLSERQFLYIGRQHIENEEKENEPIDIQLILADDSVYDFKGKIDFVDRNVNPSTGSIMIQASFPNKDGLLRPGQFARLHIQVEDRKNAVLVPQKVVSELQGQHSVFVVGEDNKVESRIVKTGPKTGEYWIIDEGLKPGEKVVLEGIQKIQSGIEVHPELVEFKEAGAEKK